MIKIENCKYVTEILKQLSEELTFDDCLDILLPNEYLNNFNYDFNLIFTHRFAKLEREKCGRMSYGRYGK